MLSRKVLLLVLFGLLAVAAPVASGWLVDYNETVQELTQWGPPPPDCGLYDICGKPKG